MNLCCAVLSFNVMIPVNCLELTEVHNEEMLSLDKILKDTEATLSVRDFLLKILTQTRRG